MSLDELGPIIVNKDGTTSRVTNWLEMGREEQERTQRMIKKVRKSGKYQALERGDQFWVNNL